MWEIGRVSVQSLYGSRSVQVDPDPATSVTDRGLCPSAQQTRPELEPNCTTYLPYSSTAVSRMTPHKAKDRAYFSKWDQGSTQSR